jgi:hypothetical protein
MNKPRRDQERCQGREGDRTPAPYKCYASEGAGKYAPEQTSGRGGWEERRLFVAALPKEVPSLP